MFSHTMVDIGSTTTLIEQPVTVQGREAQYSVRININLAKIEYNLLSKQLQMKCLVNILNKLYIVWVHSRPFSKRKHISCSSPFIYFSRNMLIIQYF